MTQAELNNILTELLHSWENEVVEFKSGGSGFSTDDIGEYFSALSNEANLRHIDRAWFVFGVENIKHELSLVQTTEENLSI